MCIVAFRVLKILASTRPIGNGIPSKCFKEQEERQWGQRAIHSGEEMALLWTLVDGSHCKVQTIWKVKGISSNDSTEFLVDTIVLSIQSRRQTLLCLPATSPVCLFLFV